MKQFSTHLKKIIEQLPKKWANPIPVLLLFAVIGSVILIRSNATTPSISLQAESGTVTSPATKVTDSSASNNQAVKFGAPPTSTPPPPTQPPSGSIIPSTAKVVWRGDFETGDFSQWTRVQNKIFSDPAAGYNGLGYPLTLVSGGQQRIGNFSARFELRPGDKPFAGGDRTEVSKYDQGIVREGEERWYQFSLKFDSTWTNPSSDWFIVMQWHGGSGSPPMNLNVRRDGMLELLNNAGSAQAKNIGYIRKGVWSDYVIHAKFSQSASVGWTEIYQDGQLVVPRHNRSNMSSGSNYFKEGMYAPTQSNTKILYYDGPVIYAP